MKDVVLTEAGIESSTSTPAVHQVSGTNGSRFPVPSTLARLNEAGWRVVVASNQSGVERRLFDSGHLNAINEEE